MRPNARKAKSSHARQRGHRRLSGPEQVESRCLMDGALPQLVADDFLAHANDDPRVFDVLANDALGDYDGPKLITAVSFPTAGGGVEIAADGKSVVYRPAADFSGNDTFSYVVDGQFSAQVTMQIIAPLVADEFVVFPDGQPRTFDLLANDPFWAGYAGARRITVLSATALGGTVVIGADGRSVVYTAPLDPAAVGQRDHFTYIVDGKHAANVAVHLFNPLVASNHEAPQNPGPIALGPIDVSHFEEWPGYAGPKTVTNAFASISGATVSISADGRSLSYEPAADFIGTDTITYVVDGQFGSTIRVYIGPVTSNDYYLVDENDPGTVLHVLANDYYRDSTNSFVILATVITSVTQPDQGGHVEIVENGSAVRYTPAAGFLGNETFIYRASGKYPATVSINVSRPVRDDYFSSSNRPIVADSNDNVLNVLANDFYQPGQHVITAVGTPDHGGTVTIQPGGQALLFTPLPGFVGSEQFTYMVDGTYSASVHVDVQSPAGGIYIDLDPAKGQTYRIEPAMHLPGLGDYSGNKLITAVSVERGNVTATISADGRAVLVTANDFSFASILYTFDGKYTGAISVSFRPSRFLGWSTSVVDQNSSNTLDVMANAPWQYRPYYDQDTIVYAGARLITGAFGAQHGTLSVAADGKSVLYQPHADFVGSDTFQYLVDGRELGTATVQVIRRVRDDQFRVTPDSQDNVLRVGLNDQLGGGYAGAGLITHVSAPAHGTVQIAADGRSLRYTPAAGYTGDDAITYTVDGRLKATVQVAVAADDADEYPQFENLAALEAWLVQNAIGQYASYFGRPASEVPYYYPLEYGVLASFATADSSSATTRHSETNVQVAGVDEADLVETDGEYLYVLSGGKLVISRALGGESLEVVSETTIDGSAVGIYLSGDRLTVVSRTGSSLFDHGSPWLWRPRGFPTQTTVTVFDVANRQNPLVVQITEIDGTQLDSRKVGDFVYLAINNHRQLILPAPQVVEEPGNSSSAPGAQSGRYETQEEYVQRMHEQFGEVLDGLLPHYRSYRPDGSLIRSGLLLVPEEIGMPLDPADRSLLSMVTIDTVGGEPGIVATAGILASPAAEMYMNHTSAYLLRPSAGGGEGQATDILKFAFDEATGQINPVARGQVPGHVLDQFSVDEHAGDLRVATTVLNGWSDNWSGRAENDVWVLRQDGHLLELVGGLQNLAHGESIRSVRYFDERVVITTFPTAQVGIDPVYAIDLADPANPRVAGELTLPGFNQYMQFIDDTHVLTVGVNAPTAAGQGGWGSPLQVSLFDVSDFAHPRLLDQYSLSRFSSSLAQQDHHAFGWFSELGMLALPVARSYSTYEDLDGDGYRESSTIVHADEVLYFRIHTDDADVVERAVELLGTIELSTSALRTAYIGDTLYAIGDGQIVASSLADPGTALTSVAWDLPLDVDFPYYLIPPILLPIVDLWPFPVLDGGLIDRGPLEIAILSSQPSEQAQLDAAIQAARADLAARLHVSPDSALLVAIESPPPGQAGAAGPQLVFRSGERLLMYQVRGNGSVDLANSDFQFPSGELTPSDETLSPDINRDGLVSPLDVLQVINDLILHDGLHRVGDSVLRQVASAAAVAAPDVNHDGQITPLDLLLVINAMILQQAAPSAVASAAVASTSTSDGAAPQLASALTFSQVVAMPGAATSVDANLWHAEPPPSTAAALPSGDGQANVAVTSSFAKQDLADIALELTDDWSDLEDIRLSSELEAV